MSGPYDEEDAAKDTDSSEDEVREAWHTARDDAAREDGWGVPSDRHSDKDKGNDGKKKQSLTLARPGRIHVMCAVNPST